MPTHGDLPGTQAGYWEHYLDGPKPPKRRSKKVAAIVIAAILAAAIGGGLAVLRHETHRPVAVHATQLHKHVVQAPAPLPSAPAPLPSAPAPSPVSAEATLTGTCTTGLLDETTNTFVTMSDLGGNSGISQGDELAEAYQVTLTNNGSTTAEVGGFSVIFYSAGYGNATTETGSNSENVNQTFIAPGQALTWTETPWGSYAYEYGTPSVGPYAGGQEGGVDSSATCQLVQWTHP
jgi:hypothetical protein